MKSLYPLILILFLSGTLIAQVGIGTTTPNANAVLELKSPGNNQGLLVPRLTTVQRTAISLSTGDNGLMVYDRDQQRFYYWQGTQWLPIRSGNDVSLEAGTGIDITGNTISSVPDADGDAANEIQDLALNGNNLSITNNNSATVIDLTPFTDADGDPSNEIQDLQLSGNTLTITNNATATAIDLAPFSGTNTDNQTLSFNATTGALGITGGNTVTVTPTGTAGGILSGTFPNPALAPGAGNDLLTVLNNASTTSTLQANRLDANVVLQSESPTGGVITGSFGGGLQISDNAITETKILDRAVTDTKLSTTGVTAGTYGSSSVIPVLNVDAQGRITSISTAGVSGSSAEGLTETLATGNDAKLQSAVNLSAVSINRSDAPGALNVNGSHFMSFTMFDDGYVVQPDDYILISNPGSPATIDLPPAAENRGRILIIRSQGGILEEAVTVTSKDGIDGAASSEPLYMEVNFTNNVAYTITVISTGVTWLTIDRGLASSFNRG